MKVELYSTASGKEVVAEFLDTLPAKDLAKVMRDIDLLSDYGTDLHEPYVKHIEGSIWELRSKLASNCYRIFYFIWRENKLILLHGFLKKTQRTPKRELDIAKKHIQDYQDRHGQMK